jgi:hypothetical protein
MHKQVVKLTLAFYCLSTLAIGVPVQARRPSAFRRFIASIFGNPTPGIRPVGKGDGTCLMSFVHASGTPPTAPTPILTKRPIFTWVGSPSKITVKSRWSQSDSWTQTQLPSDKQYIPYTGKPLEIETDYIVRLDQPGNANITVEGTSFYFSLAPENTSKQHQKELLKIDKDFKNESEKAALAKAKYLTEQGFFFDATQELLSISNPSSELQQELIAYINEKMSQTGVTEVQQVTASRALQLVLSIQQPSPELQQLKNQLTQQVCPSAEANQPIEPQISPSETKLQPSNTPTPTQNDPTPGSQKTD